MYMLDLKKFYEQNHFKLDEKLAYGIYRKRLLSIVFKGNYIKITISFNKQLNREQGQHISTKMREIKLSHKALQNAVTTNIYLELIIYQSADVNMEFFPILESSLDLLDMLDIATCEICPICGQNLQTNSPFVRIKDSVIQGHESCIQQLVSTTSNLNHSIEEKSKKSFWKTFLISFLCMFFCLAFVTLMSFLGLFDFFSILTGWLCYLLTRFVLSKFKIPYGKNQWISNTLFSILSMFLSIYIGSIFDIYRQLENVTYGYVFQNYFRLMAANFDTFGKFVLFDLIFGLVFVVMMFISDLRKLNHFKENIKKLG